MATPRDQCNQHLACQPRERVVALECHSICKLIFTPRPSRCAYQQLVAASCEPGISISKLALENGINANLLFKWRQQWREGKLLLPSSESPQLLPVTLDAAAEQPESLAEDPETLSISCEVTFRHGTLRFNGNVSEKLLTLLIQELKR
ncbi:TPA: transposase [Escherichia coli]|nr:transposase [Escherichia coli]